jgi:DNA-binding MarR family transcriptional regulator
MLAAQRDGNRMLADLLRPHQLTPAQGEVLRVLAARPGLSLAELGQRLVCETGSPSRLVDGLVTARLVERAPGPDDRRQVALTLTGAGRPKARAVRDIEHSLHDYLAAALGPRELSRTAGALRRLVAGTRGGEAVRIRSTHEEKQIRRTREVTD